jgi:membrane protease YdiL (CAAX protease family)
MSAGGAGGEHGDPLAEPQPRRERLSATGGGLATRGVLGRPRPVLVVAAAYAAMGVAGAAAALALGIDPIACDGWLGTRGAKAVLSSLGLGISFGAVTIVATQSMVRRTAWARALHAALRPAVHGAGDASLLAIALASAVGEELLFRGLLVPLVGVVLSSLIFGALHQIRGQARWGWMALATAMGLLLAVLFRSTGSLAGSVAAHAAINGANLRYLRDHDPLPRRRPLGGLLRRT